MTQNHNRNRRIFLICIILLLVSLSYFALELTTYYEGSWQAVQGYNSNFGSKNREPFEVAVPKRVENLTSNLDVVRQGKLFFIPLPVEEAPITDDAEVGPIMPPITTYTEPPKPTCPLVVSGVMFGKVPTAILVNKQTQVSQTVQVGSYVGQFEVVEITKKYVLVKSPEAEFKLELGGM